MLQYAVDFTKKVRFAHLFLQLTDIGHDPLNILPRLSYLALLLDFVILRYLCNIQFD
jgi:hypothetical protein